MVDRIPQAVGLVANALPLWVNRFRIDGFQLLPVNAAEARPQPPPRLAGAEARQLNDRAALGGRAPAGGRVKEVFGDDEDAAAAAAAARRQRRRRRARRWGAHRRRRCRRRRRRRLARAPRRAVRGERRVRRPLVCKRDRCVPPQRPRPRAAGQPRVHDGAPALKGRAQRVEGDGRRQAEEDEGARRL
ncbi:hypothetical protein BU14_0053s0033 [Porphyra umbilicalis]|uniref:Uncharacterized protein n=1 Tax=Porphyra umbilicalis TaxID=2786 RepID=A0A1X6PHL9_PORUM|nr:hypothetical protein BU14_0053s0033 [Porphyra umbilicalis]|eukprot:OSX80369.1 hypothetical protein BU14_0053s0033 [Porphyra umbilicalis]